jgi:septal ring factor EnvC (AmiA/AmiB activator)
VTDPSTGSGSWLTVSEAATRTGLHIDRLRSMIRRGKLEKRRGNRGEWLVLVPAEMMTGSDLVGGSVAGAADHANGSAEGDLDRVDGSVMSKLTDALTELAALEHELGAALTRSAVAEAEAATLRDALTKTEAMADQLRAEHRVTVAELRAELAEARRPWLAKVLEGLRRKGS